MIRPLPASLLTEIANRVGPEWFEWYMLTPGERWEESARLWQTYLAFGGSLDPLPNPKRPDDVRDVQGSLSADGGSSLRPVRRL
jgi:hypothetical protein